MNEIQFVRLQHLSEPRTKQIISEFSEDRFPLHGFPGWTVASIVERLDEEDLGGRASTLSKRTWMGTLSYDVHLVAFLLLEEVAAEAEIMIFNVKETYRKQGFGKKLLQEGIHWAKQHQIANIHLEVETTNQAAFRLYESIGFETQSFRRDYYGLGRNACRMMLRLPLGLD